jgi:UDP-N-acetylmuramoyl-tripeptide--D-alanyl-D-alanine ligase
MAELGDDATAWHDKVAQAVVDSGIEHVICVGGAHAQRMIRIIRDAGITAEAANPETSLAEQVNHILQAGDVVLVKGANALGLGAVVRQLAGMSTR